MQKIWTRLPLKTCFEHLSYRCPISKNYFLIWYTVLNTDFSGIGGNSGKSIKFLKIKNTNYFWGEPPLSKHGNRKRTGLSKHGNRKETRLSNIGNREETSLSNIGNRKETWPYRFLFRLPIFESHVSFGLPLFETLVSFRLPIFERHFSFCLPCFERGGSPHK